MAIGVWDDGSGCRLEGSPPFPHHGYRIGVRYDGLGVGLLAVVRGSGASVSPPGPLGTGPGSESGVTFLRRHAGGGESGGAWLH